LCGLYGLAKTVKVIAGATTGLKAYRDVERAGIRRIKRHARHALGLSGKVIGHVHGKALHVWLVLERERVQLRIKLGKHVLRDGHDGVATVAGEFFSLRFCKAVKPVSLRCVRVFERAVILAALPCVVRAIEYV
jgi:hypothetical protein